MDETGTETVLADHSPLVRIFKDEGMVRMLDVFLQRRSQRMGASKIAELAGVSPPTVYRHVDDLLELGIVRRTDGPTGARYELDTDSELVADLEAFYGQLHRHAAFVFDRTDRSPEAVAAELLSDHYRRRSRRAVADRKDTDRDSDRVREVSKAYETELIV
ncbi:MAG: winged helix-turn-helix domain-containing protein [Halobacteriota archaeon]